MSGDPKKPVVGEFIIDASELAPFLVDLPPGALQGLRVEKEGIDDVIREIEATQALWGDKAGVTQGDFTELQTNCARIDQVDVFLGASRKLVEILEETRALLVDQRERVIHAIAKSVDGRAKTQGGRVLLAKYEKTRLYRSLSANKGVKTRQRNAQNAEAEAEAEAEAKAEAEAGPDSAGLAKG
jgi:hypothetical protein